MAEQAGGRSDDAGVVNAFGFLDSEAASLLLLGEENPAVKCAAALLPGDGEEPFESRVPVADAWFLAFERKCLVQGVTRRHLKRELLARLGPTLSRAPRLCASAFSTDFMSYEEVRSHFLQACFPLQDPAYIFRVAESLKGQGLSPAEAGGWLVLLECLLKRAFAMHSPYTALDEAATKRRLFEILFSSLKPFAARTAASLAVALRETRLDAAAREENFARFCGRLLALRNFVFVSEGFIYSEKDPATLGFDFNADLHLLEERALQEPSNANPQTSFSRNADAPTGLCRRDAWGGHRSDSAVSVQTLGRRLRCLSPSSADAHLAQLGAPKRAKLS